MEARMYRQKSYPRSHRLLQAALLCCAFAFCAAASAARPFERLVVFGDSLTDAGNAFVLTHQVSVPPYQLIPDLPYARGGHHFSNGETWVEQLAKQQGLRSSACPALPAPGRCSDYAVGGARARPGAAFDLGSQIEMFLGDFAGVAPGHALYVVHIGGNDVRDALVALALDPTGQQSVIIMGDALESVANGILALTRAGAREFVVPNMPNFALVPAIRLQGPQAQAAGQALSVAYNNTLAGILTNLEAQLPIKIHRLDVYALINETVAQPAAAGFTEVQSPCITPGVIVHAECAQPDRFLFWDGIHPTRAGHGVLAQRARELLGLDRHPEADEVDEQE
jgi:phospholipase/lecithinase/hemolysin